MIQASSYRISLALLALALLPRLVGLAINLEANDDHLEVVKLWLASGIKPDVDACWECFQPPLYSTLIYSVASATQTNSDLGLWLIAHALNLGLSIVIISTLWRVTRRLNLSGCWRNVLFLFFACNPKLVAINIQATNDTLLIAICLVLIELTSHLIKTFKANSNKLLLLSAIWTLALLAGLTKGNGLVAVAITLGAVIITLVGNSTSLPIKHRFLAIGAFLLLPFLIAVVGPFAEQLARKGTPFAINQPQAPFPSLLSYDGYQGKRLGVRSVVDSLGTFRFIDLLNNPALSNSHEPIPLHRTSFWTLLYGQAFHAQYEQFPPSWANRSEIVANCARGLYLLGLVPLGIALLGFTERIRKLFQKPAEIEDSDLLEKAEIFDLLMVFGYLVFLVMYSLDYRDFANTKIIFLFPALGPFIRIFSSGIEKLLSAVETRGTLARWQVEVVIGTPILAMIFLYTVNLTLLYLTILSPNR